MLMLMGGPFNNGGPGMFPMLGDAVGELLRQNRSDNRICATTQGCCRTCGMLQNPCDNSGVVAQVSHTTTRERSAPPIEPTTRERSATREPGCRLLVQ